jgi:membrane-associated phospholipid phosphatase
MRLLLKPVDTLSLLFIGLLSAVTIACFSLIPFWGWLVIRYALLALAIVSLALYNGQAHPWKPAVYLQAFLPVLIVMLIFDSLGDLIPRLWPHYFDTILIKIDYAMFGVHPTLWTERLIHSGLTTALQFAYISYYPMSITLAVVLLVKKKQEEFDTAVFGLILCFYLSYVGYILFPAVGPRFTLAHLQTTGLQANSLTTAIQNTLNGLEHNKTDAFPSGHTAVALMTLYYAWKSREKALAGVLLPLVSGLIFATVYLRYHYVIDVIAGVLLTAVTIYLAPKLYQGLSGSTKQPNN